MYILKFVDYYLDQRITLEISISVSKHCYISVFWLAVACQYFSLCFTLLNCAHFFPFSQSLSVFFPNMLPSSQRIRTSYQLIVLNRLTIRSNVASYPIKEVRNILRDITMARITQQIFRYLRWAVWVLESTLVDCCSDTMCKSELRDASLIHCDCGAPTQSMQLLLNLVPCTREYLYVAADKPVKITIQY